jgi:hypothetical protein
LEGEKMSNNKSVKMLLSGLGIVFGFGVGMLDSILCSFHIVTGMIGGAAAGLLIGLVASMLSGKGSGAKGRV